MANEATDLAFGQLCNSLWIRWRHAPEDRRIHQLLSRIDVIDFQLVPAITVHARTILQQPLLATCPYPLSLVLTLYLWIFVSHDMNSIR